MNRYALVTGGAGFIGGHLAAELVNRGWNVRILDNFSSGRWENLAPLAKQVEVVKGDVRSEADCREACRGVDTVFHMAAIASVAGSVADPVRSHEVNVGGTLQMLMAARDSQVRRFVFSSSASVYGNSEQVPTTESQVLSPESPYAAGKACGEFYCRNFWSLYGLETVVLRYFNVFGPRQSLVSGYAAVVPAWVEAALEDGRPVVFGDGLQTRDFVYVQNVVSANLQAALAPGASGGVFNVGCGEGISLLQLLAELSRISGAPLEPEFRVGREGEIRHSRSDISRARTVLGYTPEVGLAEGLERTFEATAAGRDARQPAGVA